METETPEQRARDGAVSFVEIVSPLADASVDCLCRIAKHLRATCDRCGFTTREVHMGMAFHGWFCSRCCYACAGEIQLSPAEFEQMERNQLGVLLEDDVRDVVEAAAPDESTEVKLPIQTQKPHPQQAEVDAIRRLSEGRGRRPNPNFMNKTLRVDEGFSGTGFAYDFIRDSDGQSLYQLWKLASDAALSLDMIRRILCQGIADGTLTVE